MRREDLDLRHVGVLFCVVLVLLSAVDLVLDERIGARDVVLNVVAAGAVVGASLFPTFRLPGRGRSPGREELTAATVGATVLAGVLVVAAVLV
jgi:hypothetical protein